VSTPSLAPTAAGDAGGIAELERRSRRLRVRAAELLGVEVPLQNEDHAEAALACMEAIAAQQVDAAAEPSTRGDVRGELLADLQEVVLELQDFHGADRLRRVVGCERGLHRLRRCATPWELVDRACDELATSCGFGRVLLSRIDDGAWRPLTGNSTLRAQPWFKQWRSRAIPLEDLYLERQVITDLRPALVRDTWGPGLHVIVRQILVGSYVIAPIAPGGEPIGWFHGSHITGGRSCGETDRDVIAAFADGFGRMYERLALLERVQRRRHGIRETLREADTALQELGTSERELALQPVQVDLVDSGAPTPDTAGAGLDALTRRELEVLRLIARGAGNHEIAAELVVTVATVKSHVNRLLAKLGAVNRTQAIGHFRRAERGQNSAGT
jgi:LuxR family transcriptional regulator, regulator of acetate metabolism